MKNGLGLLSLIAVIVIAGPTSAQAHSGAGIGAGFLHPIDGLDHLLMLIAIGVLAGRAAGKSVWGIPVLFLILMAIGTVIPLDGIAIPFTGIEILVSVAILVFLAAISLRLSWVTSILLTGALAVLHGVAHGATMAAFVPGSFLAGFLASTIIVMVVGITVGKGLEALRQRHQVSEIGEEP